MARKTIENLLAEARSRLVRLEPEEALEAQGRGAVIVDTRSHDERRRAGIIPGSIHVPRSVLEWRLDPDNEPRFRNPYVGGLDTWIVLVCAHGFSTSLAASTLQDLGFSRATDVIGGFTEWKERGLPVIASPPVDENATPGTGGPDGQLG